MGVQMDFMVGISRKFSCSFQPDFIKFYKELFGSIWKKIRWFFNETSSDRQNWAIHHLSEYAMIQIIEIFFYSPWWYNKNISNPNSSRLLQTSLVCRSSSHPRQNSLQNAVWRDDEWVRTITGTVRTASQLHREGRGEGAPRKVSHRQIRNPPDESDPQALGRGDVAVWWAPEAVRSTSK